MAESDIDALFNAVEDLEQTQGPTSEAVARLLERLPLSLALKPFSVKVVDGECFVYAPAGSLYLRDLHATEAAGGGFRYKTYQIDFDGVDSQGWARVDEGEVYAVAEWDSASTSFKARFASSVPDTAVAWFKVAQIDEDGFVQSAYGAQVATIDNTDAFRPVVPFEVIAVSSDAAAPCLLPGGGARLRIAIPDGCVTVDGVPAAYSGVANWLDVTAPGEYWGWVYELESMYEDEPTTPEAGGEDDAIGPPTRKFAFTVGPKSDMAVGVGSFPICRIHADGTVQQYVLGSVNVRVEDNKVFSAFQVVQYAKAAADGTVKPAFKIFAPEGGALRLDGGGVAIEEADKDGWVDLGSLRAQDRPHHIWLYLDKGGKAHIAEMAADPASPTPIPGAILAFPVADIDVPQ